MTQFAHVQGGEVNLIQQELPPLFLDHEGAWELSPEDMDGAAARGWYTFEVPPKPDDDETTVWHEWVPDVVDGRPVAVWQSRPREADEPFVSEVEQNARLTDLEARVARLEALAEPPPPNPTDPDDPNVKTWTEWGGVWASGGLLLEGDTVYRNVATEPLTTPPSLFPGPVSRWTHLFVVVLGDGDPPPDPGPTRPPGYVGTWDAATRYEVGNVVDRDGRYYRCLVGHGAEYGGTWGPPTLNVWTDIGSVENLNRRRKAVL